MMNSCTKESSQNLSTLPKKPVRIKLHSVRNALSFQRREEAKSALTTTLWPQLQAHRFVCSFCSVGSEIDTSTLNQLLAAEGRLVLPKMENSNLQLYLVTDLQEQLESNSRFFSLLEPVPEICTQVPLEEITCVLVPALGFDHDQRRIGYGKGYYDRLIAQAKAASLPLSFMGIGFQEQMQSQPLPAGPHDMPLDTIYLF